MIRREINSIVQADIGTDRVMLGSFSYSWTTFGSLEMSCGVIVSQVSFGNIRDKRLWIFVFNREGSLSIFSAGAKAHQWDEKSTEHTNSNDSCETRSSSPVQGIGQHQQSSKPVSKLASHKNRQGYITRNLGTPQSASRLRKAVRSRLQCAPSPISPWIMVLLSMRLRPWPRKSIACVRIPSLANSLNSPE